MYDSETTVNPPSIITRTIKITEVGKVNVDIVYFIWLNIENKVNQWVGREAGRWCS